jgi:preprotein translocase subunit SecE
VAEKPVKVKEPVKNKTNAIVEKVKPVQTKLAAAPAKAVEKAKEKPKKETKLSVWWRETVGELRKVTWPTIPEARRMTVIVLIVMGATALVLGAMDRIFSWLIGLLVAL